MKYFALCVVLFAVCEADQIPGGSRPITDEGELNELTETVKTHLTKVGAQENSAQLNFLRVHSATVSVVSGRLYKLIAEINENNTPVNCSISLWDKPWIPEFVKFDVECGEEKRKYGYSSALDRAKRQIGFGGFSTMGEEELKQLHPKLSTTFDHLKATKSDFEFTLKRIISGKSQVVAGSHYIVQVEVTNKHAQVKQCEADILENLQDQFHQVDVKCDNKSFQFMKQ